MAYARVSYTGDGSNTIFAVPFPYLSRTYVEVRLKGTLVSEAFDYTWLTDSTIQFLVAPTSGATVLITRNTPKDSRLVNYQDGGILREATLDLDSDQAFHAIQETLDAVQYVREVETFLDGVGYTSGTSTSITLAGGDVLESSILVMFDGVVQQASEYDLSDGVLTFTDVIPLGIEQIQVSYATPLTGGFPDGSITTPKMVDGTVTAIKMALGALSADTIGRSRMEDGYLTTSKLDDGVFSGLSLVTPTTADAIPIADTSDGGKKKKSAISTILGLIASATTAVRGLIQLATGAEVSSATNATKAVTPQTAPHSYSAVKAWVAFNGTTGAILGSGGVSAVTRNSAGDYFVTFANSFSSANYCVVGLAQDDNASNGAIVTRHSTQIRTVNNCGIKTIESVGGAHIDCAYVCVAFMGYW